MLKACFVIGICILQLLTAAECSLQRKKKEILDKLLDPDKYDPQMKPGVLSDIDTPTTVSLNMHVLSISNVDDLKMMYTLELYVRQQWKDERLEFRSLTHKIDYIILNQHNRIWVPDLFFTNEHKSYFHDIMESNSMVKIFEDGTVLTSARVTLVLRCPMKFSMLPFDSQVCPLNIESYTWKGDQINLEWQNGTAVTVNDEILSPLFVLERFWTDGGLIATGTGEYSSLALHFQLARKADYYLLQVYIPCAMLFIVSCLPFWLNPRLITARVLIGTGVLLSTGFHITSCNTQLPKVAYTKAIDVFTGMTLTFIFCTLMETIFVHVSESKSSSKLQTQESVPRDDVEQSEKVPYKSNAIVKMKAWLYEDHKTLNDIDAASRALFPTCFILFLFIYTLTCVSVRTTTT